MPRTERVSSQRHWWKIIVVTIAIGVGAWLLWRSDFSLKQLTNTIAGFNSFVVLLLMAALPIGGFSIGVMYVVAGIKFGPVLGGVAVAGATAVHLLATHWICQTVLRERLKRFLERRKHRLPAVPEGENASVAAMAALVPGLPYFSRNVLLALTTVPLRVYFWICLPIYVVRSYVAILIGDIGTDLNRRTLIILGLVYALKLGICGYLIMRFRRRLKLTRQSRNREPAEVAR
jgi:uncharacterized membrane protein YdjX (TVP38/TMEM64 family)